MRSVTVPGSHSGCSEPIIAFLPGGIENLNHRLADAIRQALAALGHKEPEHPGFASSVSGAAGKAFDVVS